jgi:hypothetical protein
LFLDLARTTMHKKGAHLHAGCVTRNEVHLAIQCGESPVSAITRSFCHEYARRFNRMHAEDGRLFRARPHVLLIQHRLWLVPLVHVIHWVPQRRQLQLGVGEKYWSSDKVYRGRGRVEGLITHVVLHIVSGGMRRRDAQEVAYRKRFERPPDDEQIRLLSKGSPDDPRILGDAEFLAETWLRTHQESPLRNPAGPVIGDVRNVVVGAVEKFGAMCDLALTWRQARAWKRVVTLEQLCSRSRKRPLPVIRALITSYVMASHIATRSQAARFFGCRPDTLSMDRRRHAEMLFFKWFGGTSDKMFPSGRGN